MKTPASETGDPGRRHGTSLPGFAARGEWERTANAASTMADRARQLGFRVASHVAPAHSLRAAEGRYRPRADRTGPLFRDIAHGFLERGDERIAIYHWPVEGRRTVLLAHDWAGDSAMFDGWVKPLLEAGHAVLAFDQPGHGGSSGRCMPWQFVDVLREMAMLAGPFAAIVAHGHGALAATLLLAERAVAEKAVLIAPPADPSEHAVRFARALGLSPTLSGRFAHLDDAVSPASAPRLIPAHMASRIGCPALVVHDLYDEVIPWSDGECYARHWPHSHLLTTSGLTHAGIVSSSQTIAASMRFLAGETVGRRVVASPAIDALLHPY